METPSDFNLEYINLEYLADAVPAVFEEILLNLDHASISNVTSTNKIIRRSVHSMIKSKRILPFKDTTVVVSKSSWAMGFNTFKFYGFCWGAPRKKLHTVQFKNPVGKEGLLEMDMRKLAKRIKYFAPRKYIFDISYNPAMLDKHLEFMKQVEVDTGTTTEIMKAMGPRIALICAVIKPKKLILLDLFMNPLFDPDTFANEAFQCVKHLSIRGFRANHYQAAQSFNLEAISNNLILFEFSGSIPEFPCTQVNLLLQKWSIGKNPLKNVKIVTQSMEADTVMDHVIEGIQNTPVERISQLPDFMQNEIAKDLLALDWKAADITCRLLLCPSKRQMGFIYFCKFLESVRVIGNHPRDNASSYLGFHAFDYFPVK